MVADTADTADTVGCADDPAMRSLRKILAPQWRECFNVMDATCQDGRSMRLQHCDRCEVIHITTALWI